MYKLPLVLGIAVAAQAADSSDSLISNYEARKDSLAEYAASTVVGRDDKPVSMSGDITTRLRNYEFDQPNTLLENDKARSFVDANLNIAMVAVPNSYINFWTTLNFPFDFSGYYTNYKATAAYQSPNVSNEKVEYNHHADYYSTSLWEDVTAGIDVRGGQFAGMVKAGGVIWLNSSPLTIWEREAWPKFPSTYETFEEERTVSTYYKEKTFRPVMEGGRAFWTNRSFGGILLDAYKMPFGMSAQFLLAQPKDDDFGTRDGLRLLAGQPGEVEMAGTLDFRGDVIHGRIAKSGLGDLTLGANYVGLFTDNGIIYEPAFSGSFKNKFPSITDYHVTSLDLRGNVLPKLFILVDAAVSMDDSTIFPPRADGSYDEESFLNEKSDPAFGMYAKVQSKYGLPVTVEASYITENFYSPYGMTDYSRNRTWRKEVMPLGAGAFRYCPNIMGANVKIEPDFNRGRFNVLYSQHRQVVASQNILSFPFRMNGRNLSEAYMGWSKYNTALLFDDATGNTYRSRIGGQKSTYLGDERGGLRGGTWELWEFFGAFENGDQASKQEVPEDVKWANTISIDMGYDIGHWFNTDRNIMLAGIVSISGISKSFMPITYGDDEGNLMLWTVYAQAEPAIAITPTFHALLIGGIETFRAPDSYYRNIINEQQGQFTYQRAPINYLQTAVGFGFDWDFAARAGLHVRYKRATNKDETMSENDWKAHFVTAETKVWF